MKPTLLARMRNEQGSAMTEFVITLPIFIMIFAGMGMLYRYSHEGMVARMKTNRILVDNATAPNSIAGFVPGIGGTISIASFGDVVVNGSGALGMYWDSYIKAGLAESIIPGTQIMAPANPVQNDIQQITGMSGLQASQSFTNAQLNDLAHPHWDGGGWANILWSIVGTIGVAPAGAAGIRYLPVQAQTSHTFSHGWSGSTTYDPGMLQLAAPTAAHHRVVAVASSRIAANTIEPYKECILEFDIPLCSSAASGSTTALDGANDAANACRDQSNIWQGCMAACGDPATEPSWPSYPSGAPIWGCYGCNCHCDGERPPDSCADIGGGMGDFADPNDVPGCPGAYCNQPRP